MLNKLATILSSQRKLGSMMLLFICLLAFSGCDKVTETGNPCPAGDCTPTGNKPPTEPTVQDPTAEPGSPGTEQPYADYLSTLSWYENIGLKVKIGYPNNWTKSGVQSTPGGAMLNFTSPDTQATKVYVMLDYVGDRTATLHELANESSCDGTFAGYDDNPNLEGYVCDLTRAGARGGDAKQYYFLSGTTFIYINAEIFSAGIQGFEKILQNIKPL